MRRLHYLFEISIFLFAGASDHDAKMVSSSALMITVEDTVGTITPDATLIGDIVPDDALKTAGLQQKTLSCLPDEHTTTFILGQIVEARYTSGDEFSLATVVSVHIDGDSESYGLLYSSGELEYSVKLGMIRAVDGSDHGDSISDGSVAAFDIRTHSERMMVGVEARDGKLQRYRLTLTTSGDPWRISERFCFVSSADDELCKHATAAVLHRYSIAFGDTGYEPTPAPACDVLQQGRYPTPSTVHDLAANETLKASLSSLSSIVHSPTQAVVNDNPVRDWLEAAREWQSAPSATSPVPAREVATSRFDPNWPWDMRLGTWVSEARRAVFSPPVISSECKAEKESTYGPSMECLRHGDNPGDPEAGAGDNSASHDDDEDDEGKWIEDLVAIAMAPWAKAGVTAADVDAAVLADPKVWHSMDFFALNGKFERNDQCTSSLASASYWH